MREDPLKFRDSSATPTGSRRRGEHPHDDAFTAAFGTIEGGRAVVGVQDFMFMGGSMGQAVGSAFVAAAQRALDEKCGFVVVTAAAACDAGGILSLMQMPEATVMTGGSRKRACPTSSVLTDPTTAALRELRDARRRSHRRARRAHRLAGQRVIQERIRETVRRASARQVPARVRHGRHGRAEGEFARCWQAARVHAGGGSGIDSRRLRLLGPGYLDVFLHDRNLLARLMLQRLISRSATKLTNFLTVIRKNIYFSTSHLVAWSPGPEIRRFRRRHKCWKCRLCRPQLGSARRGRFRLSVQVVPCAGGSFEGFRHFRRPARASAARPAGEDVAAARAARPRHHPRTAAPAWRSQKQLPPTFHVAGTNGKGSTCAYLRAMLEAQGRRVHVATKPHLVRYNERTASPASSISDELPQHC